MLFFKRILKFDEKTVAKQEKRYASRFKVSATSPLKASLAFDYLQLDGTVINLSTLGAAVLLPKEFACPRNTPCKITFTLETQKLTLDAVISHHRKTAQGKQFGLELALDDFETRLCFLQLIEPLGIGATLAPAKRKAPVSAEPGLIAKQYHSANDTMLTIWRNYAGQAITGFEFKMRDFYVRNGKTAPELLVYTHESQDQTDQPGYDAPTLKRTSKEHRELRQLFDWVVPHLNDKLPEDVRSYLRQYTRSQGTGSRNRAATLAARKRRLASA